MGKHKSYKPISNMQSPVDVQIARALCLSGLVECPVGLLVEYVEEEEEEEERLFGKINVHYA